MRDQAEIELMVGRTHKAVWVWFFAFFVVSGFCSLVYEVIWLRLTMAKFGVTTPMVSIVLSVFMAGLALGSWFGGALVRRLKGESPAVPLRLYGIVELLIGLSAVAVPYLLQLGYEFSIGGWLAWDSSGYYLMSGGWVALSLLPWCTCMGATFPLAMEGIRRSCPDASERSFSFLYVSNVLGAILGTLLPAFVLIEVLGFQQTLRVAMYFNGVLAGAVFAASFLLRPSTLKQSNSDPTSRIRASTSSLRHYPLLLFLTGLATMAMEVVWIRQFTVYLGNVVYAFAAILALYLAATCAGSLLYRHWASRNPSHHLANAWLLVGPLSLLPLAFSDLALPVPDGLFGSIFRTAAGIVPFSALLGFLTPLLVDEFSEGDPDRAGRAYAINILGAIAGPLLAGFLILPWMSDHHALAVLSLPLFGIGFLFAVQQQPESTTRASATANGKAFYAAVVVVSLALVAVTKGIEAALRNRIELRDHTATVIATGEGLDRRMIINGFGMTSLTPITKYMAHLPLAFMDRQPQNGLVICFGMGTTFRSMLSWGIDSTVVELIPSVPKLFGYYHADGPELTNSPLGHIVIDDGRRFLERSADLYDVITLDPPPPITTPTTSLLYSKEFYQLVKKRLRSDGIFHAWLAVKDSGWDVPLQASFSKALAESFPYVRAFPSLNGTGFHFLASTRPLTEKSAAVLAARLPRMAAADLLEWGPYTTAEEMFGEVLRTEQSMQRLIALDALIPPLQDDRPTNEYFFVRRLFDNRIPLGLFSGIATRVFKEPR